jgi:hypothetical protein
MVSMIIFLIYIIVLIYLYEFYIYTIKLKTQIKLQNNKTVNSIKEQFENNTSLIDPSLDPYCTMKPANEIEMSENVLEPPTYSYQALQSIDKKSVPYPSDDSRAYENPDFNRKPNSLPPRHKRDIRWHCIRDYMICHTPTNYLEQLDKPLPKSITATIMNSQNNCP